MSIKLSELRAKLREHRKMTVPAVSRMRKADVVAELEHVGLKEEKKEKEKPEKKEKEKPEKKEKEKPLSIKTSHKKK